MSARRREIVRRLGSLLILLASIAVVVWQILQIEPHGGALLIAFAIGFTAVTHLIHPPRL